MLSSHVIAKLPVLFLAACTLSANAVTVSKHTDKRLHRKLTYGVSRFTKSVRLSLSVAMAQKALNSTNQKLADLQALKARLENKEQSDKEIDSIVHSVANETESPALAHMLGSMWTDMRMFAVPEYTEYLNEEIHKLQEQETLQQQNLPAAAGTETALAPSTTVAAAPLAAAPQTTSRPYWPMLVTWLVLIVLSFVTHKIMRRKAWSAKHRVPYTAALIILWTIVFFATSFYFLCTHEWSWLECMYYCIVTVTTVGYGDYVPDDTVPDKLLLLWFLWSNAFVLSIVLGLVVTPAEEGLEERIKEESKSKAPATKMKGLRLLFVCVVGMTLFGAVLFMLLEGWTFLEGLTFATVTLSTVGYGYLLPNDGPTSMICASFFILIGVPLMGAFVGKLGGVIDDALKTRKQSMSTGKQLLVYSALVIGWLLFGATGFHTFNGHGWDWPECLYLAAVTMTTVGYGDYVPENTFTDHIMVIIYIWGSVIVIATVFGDLDDLLLDLLTKGMNRHKSLMTRIGLLGLIVSVGVAGVNMLEGWGILNSFVYTSVTCTTVGYGHFTPSHPDSRLFAVVFIVISVPLFGSLVSNISSQYSDKIQKLVADFD